MTGYGHEGHDNQDRMPFVCAVLQHNVLPHVASEANVSGYYSFELHDSYTYLGRDASTYDNVMTFSKFKDHPQAICVPDVYQLCRYGGQLMQDPHTFVSKRDTVVGAYTTTGDRDPTRNERVQTCLWSLGHRDVCQLSITKIAQMTAADLFAQAPRAREVMAPFVSPTEQMRHKFILNIKGNTETWDQAWMLNSNSLVLKKHSREMCWYGPLMQDGVHYVRCCSNEQVLDAARRYVANPRDAERITANAQQLVRSTLFPPTQALLYWVRMFEESAANRA